MTEPTGKSSAFSFSSIFERFAVRDWRWLGGVFFTAFLLESIAFAHLEAFTPLFLRDELGMPLDEIAVWTGVLTAITFGISFPLTPFWGSLAERYSRKLIIVRSEYLEAVGYLMCAFAPDLAWLIAGRVVLGLTFGNIALITTTQTLLTPPSKVSTSIAIVQAAGPIALTIGPLMGALLLPYIGLRGVMVFDAVACLISGLLITFLMPEPEKPKIRRSVLGNIKVAYDIVMTRPELKGNFFAWFITRGTTAVVATYLPVRITELAGADAPNAIGIILSGFGLITAISTWLAGPAIARWGTVRTYWPIMLGAGVTMLGVAFGPTVWVIGAFNWLRAVPVGFQQVVLYAHLAEILDRDEVGPVMSFTPVPRNVASFSLPLIAAAIAAVGTSAALASASGMYLVAAWSGWRMGKPTARRLAELAALRTKREAPP